jgi:hypothetical protein
MDFEALQRSISGAIIPRADTRHAAAREALLWSTRKPPRQPLAIVRAASMGDVQAVVRFAQNHTARSAAWKPTFEWVPSQKGLLVDAPQRQSATVSLAG